MILAVVVVVLACLLLVAGVMAVFALLGLLVKALPLLLLGWVAVKVIRRLERPRPAYRGSDVQWLDTRR